MIVSPRSCLFYRLAGSMLTCISIFTIILTVRYFYYRYCHYRKGLPLSPVLIGMLVSLIMILCTGISLVLIQCFTCKPLKTYIGICKINAFISLCWSLPPLVNLGNTYINEGIGFHCSLDWNNSGFQSRLFLYSLIICTYFFLLIILIYSNLRIYFVLHYLFKSNKYFNSSLMIINGKIELVRQYPIYSILAELMAKYSLILNPLIVISTSQMREY